jgi:hypothetical protein
MKGPRNSHPENLHANLDGEGEVSERLREPQAVVAFGGIDKTGLELGRGRPVEFAGVDDNSSDGRSVSSDPLCSRLNDNVGAELDGTDEVATAAEGVLWERESASQCQLRRGQVERLTSTIKGIWFLFATAANAGISGMLYLCGCSEFGRIAAEE